MRRKNLWLRLSSCTMAAMIATTSLPVAAADFGSDVAVESQQLDVEEETVEETEADVTGVDADVEDVNTDSDDVDSSDFSAEAQEADLFSDSAEAPEAGEETPAQTGFGTAQTELAKGTYNVTVSLKKTDKTSDSMAASCIAGKGTLKVAEDGSAKLTVPLTSVTVGSTIAWASEWKIYKNYESETDKGLTDAESATDAEGHVNSITFDIPDKTQDGVFVNMKSGGPNANDAYIAIDYATAEKVEESTDAVDTTALETSITKAESLEENSYTKVSWDANKDAIAEALTAAKAALEAKESQTAVDTANTALTEAMGKLVEAGDPTELQKVIDEAKALKEEDYTESSVKSYWSNIQNYIAEGEAAIAGRESSSTLGTIKNKLNNNISWLVKAADTTKLQKILNQAEALKEENYTAESWKASDITSAILNAKGAIQSRGDKDAVYVAVNKLETAMDALVATGIIVGRGNYEMKLTPGTYKLPIELLNGGRADATNQYTTADYMSYTSMAAGCFGTDGATLVIHEDGTATLTTKVQAIKAMGMEGAASEWTIYENTQDYLDGKANSQTGTRFNAHVDKNSVQAGKKKPAQISFTIPDLKQNVVAAHMYIEVMSVYQDACIGLNWAKIEKISDETSSTSTVEKTYVVKPDTLTQMTNMKDGDVVTLDDNLTLKDALTVKGGTIDLNGHTLDQQDNIITVKGNVKIIDSSNNKTGKIISEKFSDDSTTSILVQSGSLNADGVAIDGQIGNKIKVGNETSYRSIDHVSVNLENCTLTNTDASGKSTGNDNIEFTYVTKGVDVTVNNCTADSAIQVGFSEAGDNIYNCTVTNSKVGELVINSSKKVVTENVTASGRVSVDADEMSVNNITSAGLTIGGAGDVTLEGINSVITRTSGYALTVSGTGTVTVKDGVFVGGSRSGYAVRVQGFPVVLEGGYFKAGKGSVRGAYKTPEGKILGDVTEGEYAGYQTVVDGTLEDVENPVATIYNEDGSVAKKISEDNASLAMTYAEEGQTVKLNRDMSADLNYYKDCILDLNGYTLTSENGITGNAGICHVIDSSEAKTGKVVSTIIFNCNSKSSSMILDNVTCEATYAHGMSVGSLYVINDTKFSGVTTVNAAMGGGITYVHGGIWTFAEGVDGKALMEGTVRTSQYTIEDKGDNTYTVTANDLGKAMRSFESLDASAYTKTSYAAAKAVYDEIDGSADEDIQGEVVAQKAKELNDVIAALEAPASEANKKALSDAVTAAKALKEADYTAASWKGFAEALAAAEKAAADEDLSDNTAVSAAKALTDAQAKLVVNKKEAAAQSITGVASSISKTFGAKAFNLNAKAKTALSYKSSNTDVVTVDGKGNVTLKGNGTATITISAEASADYKAATKTVTVKVASYKGAKKQSVTGVKTTISKKYKDKAFRLNAKAKTKLTYVSSNTKVATVDKNGKVTIKGAGTAKITIKAAETTKYKRTSKTVTIKVAKAAPVIKVKAASKSYKASALKKKAQSFKLGASANSKGKVSFKKTSGNAGIAVSSTGKVTVKKGLKKGTYKVKVRVSAAANGSYKARSKTVTVTVKVK